MRGVGATTKEWRRNCYFRKQYYFNSEFYKLFLDFVKLFYFVFGFSKLLVSPRFFEKYRHFGEPKRVSATEPFAITGLHLRGTRFFTLFVFFQQNKNINMLYFLTTSLYQCGYRKISKFNLAFLKK